MEVQTKPIQERLKESISILQQLNDLGVHKTTAAYKELSEKFNEWVRGGEAWSGDIEFPRYNRIAQVSLPTKPGRVATCNFLVKR
jgi:hypothetical protein